MHRSSAFACPDVNELHSDMSVDDAPDHNLFFCSNHLLVMLHSPVKRERERFTAHIPLE